MKKTLIILALSILAVANVHAGVELRSSVEPSTNGVYVLQLINTETQEVIDTKRFQYNDARIAILVDDVPLAVQTEAQDLDESNTIPTAHGFGDDDVADQPDVTDATGQFGSGSNTPQEVGKWDAVIDALKRSKDSLSAVAAKLQTLYGQGDDVTQAEAAETLPESVVPRDENGIAIETVTIEPQVVVPAEEVEPSADVLPSNDEVDVNSLK